MKPAKKKNGHTPPAPASPASQEAEQFELCAEFAEKRVKIDQRHNDALLALETARQVELTKLEAEQALALAKLWQQQGRKLGAYHAWLLDREERRHGAQR
jgi:hypothetical protein